MPIQKGKRRKRPRRRGSGGGDGAVTTDVPTTSRATKAGSRPVARRRWEAPLWLNVMVGGFLFLLGLFFAVTPSSGGTGFRVVVLLGYFALAGLYLGKAIRQYRAKRQ